MSAQPRKAKTEDWIDRVRFASPRAVAASLVGLCILPLVFVVAVYVRSGLFIWQSVAFALLFPLWIFRARAYVESSMSEEQWRMTRREVLFVVVGGGSALAVLVGYSVWLVVFAK